MTTRPAPTIQDLRVKLCYICREEELYNEPETPPRPWVHPCKCSLIAHESCLLEWIRSSESTSRAENSIKCPQCGSKYELTSKRPLILKILSAGHRTITLGAVIVAAGTAGGVILSIGAGFYAGLASYGAFSLRQLIGRELYAALVPSEMSEWPWHAYVNLPLIPIALMFSQNRFTRAALPLAPMLLVWTVTSPSKPEPTVLVHSLHELAQLDYGIFTWPPSAALLALFVGPFISSFYRANFIRFSHWVLDTKPSPPSPQQFIWAINLPFGIRIGPPLLQREERALNANGNANANDVNEVNEEQVNIQIDIQVGEEEWEDEEEAGNILREQAQPQPQPEAQPAAPAENANPEPNANANAINGRLNIPAAAQAILSIESACTGLLIPVFANIAGALLYKLSRHSPLLQTFLGLKRRPDMIMGSLVQSTSSPFSKLKSSFGMLFNNLPVKNVDVNPWGPSNTDYANYLIGAGGLKVPLSLFAEMGFFQQIGLMFKMSIRAIFGGTQTWRNSDPIWWRNTVGLSTLVVVKDCLKLLYLYLRRRELKSRKLIDKDFAAVNPRELDLIVPW